MNDVAHFASNIGRGNPRIYYNVIPENQKSNHAQVFVELKKYDLNRFRRLLDDLRTKFAAYPGAKIEVKEFEQGPPVEAPVAIRIMGDNLTELKQIARDVEDIIAKTPGTININNPLGTAKTDLQVVNNEAAAQTDER